MDFAWSEEQAALRRSVIQFAQNELASDVVAEDQKQEFSWDGWRKCARFGVQGMPASEEYGGGGADVLTMVCALEALGYGCRNNGLIFSLNAHLWGAEIPLALFGNEEQKRRYLPRLVNGEWMGSQALIEPGGSATENGYANLSLTTRAERTSTGAWVLNGAKAFVANATLADLVIVYAAAATGAGGAGAVTAFMVEKGTPGLTFGPALERMGLRTSPVGGLTLTDCEVPESNLLGEVGSGPAILAAAAEWERICILAGELGMMERELETSARYAAERRQFGRPIGTFPAVAAKIAGMHTRLETARLALYKAAWLKKQGKHPGRESAIAKAYVADAAIQTCRDALQIHGGYGYMTEYQIERDLRDAITVKIYSGAGEDAKEIAGEQGP